MADLGDAWRWSLETSQLMAQRLVDLYEELGTAPSGGVGSTLEQELRNAQIDLERWIELSVQVFDRTFTIMRCLANAGLDARSSTDAVLLRAPAGSDCFGELWLHNVPGDGRTVPMLRCPGLATAQGESIGPSHVRFTHDAEGSGSSTTRRVLVLVDVPASVAPAIYHGSVLCEASPETAIPLRLTVLPPQPPPGE